MGDASGCFVEQRTREGQGQGWEDQLGVTVAWVRVLMAGTTEVTMGMEKEDELRHS